MFFVIFSFKNICELFTMLSIYFNVYLLFFAAELLLLFNCLPIFYRFKNIYNFVFVRSCGIEAVLCKLSQKWTNSNINYLSQNRIKFLVKFKIYWINPLSSNPFFEKRKRTKDAKKNYTCDATKPNIKFLYPSIYVILCYAFNGISKERFYQCCFS